MAVGRENWIGSRFLTFLPARDTSRVQCDGMDSRRRCDNLIPCVALEVG